VGGGWGVWTLTAKNPNAAVDTTDRLVFNGSFASDTRQLQFQIRAGTAGAWLPAPVKWTQMSSNPKFPGYLASIEFDSAPLKLAPHSSRAFQLRARRVATAAETQPFPLEFSAFLTPQPGADGQGGNFTARADTGVAPEGLTTTINGLPVNIPADGRSRSFQIHITSANHANWNIPNASFFLWQGQKYGSMSGPKACDAEVDVLDPATRQWHRVGLGAAGIADESVNLAQWATGPSYDRTLTVRITLGAGFKAGASDSTLGFGYYPGSGDPDYFWVMHKLTSNHVAGAPACVKPSSSAPAPTPGSPSTGATTPAPSSSKTGAALAQTGGGSSTGLLAASGAALIALGGAAFAAARCRARHA
jgi:LPXTG-motif cell wall-anchored protein